MEGILAIIIAVIGLSFFLKKKKPVPKPPRSIYYNWDTWAMENGYFFYVPKRNIPMTIILKEAGYSIFVYAQKCDNLIEGFHKETEVNIQLRCNIADGLYIQSWAGLPKNYRAKDAEPLIFNKAPLDDALYMEAEDGKMARWMVQRPAFVSVCERFAKEAATSRIEQRTLILRQSSYDIDKLPALINRALEYCMYIDNESLAIWNELAVAYRLNLRVDGTTGYPVIEGYHNNFHVQVRTVKNKTLQTEVIISFEPYFPRDLLVLGPNLKANETHIGRRFYELSSTGCLYSFKRKHAMDSFANDPNILAPLMQIFQMYPESMIVNGTLQIVIPGRANQEVAANFNKILALGEKFDAYCPRPTETENAS